MIKSKVTIIDMNKKGIYDKMRRLNVNVKVMEKADLTNKQLRDILEVITQVKRKREQQRKLLSLVPISISNLVERIKEGLD